MKYIILACFIFTAFSCTDKKRESEEENKPRQTVIIFCNPVALNQAYKLMFGGEILRKDPDFTVYEGLQKKSFTPDTSKVNDTLFLNTENEIILKYKYKILSQLYYRFSPGDSVYVWYSDSIINVDIVNRDVSRYEANFDLEARNVLIPGQVYSPMDKYYAPYAFMSELGENYFQKQMNDKEKYFNKAIIYFANEKKLLDSLKQQFLISNDSYNFYKKKNEYIKIKLLLNQGKLEKSEIDKIVNNYTDSLYFNEPFFYQDLMHQIVYYRNVGMTENINLGHTTVKDFRKGFDNIVGDSSLNGELKKNSLKIIVSNIGQYFSKAELKIYLDKYASMYTDTSFVDYLSEQYLLNFSDKSHNGDSLFLIDIEGNDYTFAQIMDKHKGKVLYVDFWASWCQPCLQMLPYSNALQNKFKNENVAFIYFSIDKSRQQWKQTVELQRMDDFYENYLIINPESSEYIKELQIISIPRYILYNKDGVLVNRNAPSPKSEGLPGIIMEFLSQQEK